MEDSMTSRQQIVPVQLPDQVKIQVEATVLGGEEDVSFRVQSFQGVIDAIESIASAMDTAVQKIKPDKASVEFGLEMAIESGELTALLVKGSGTANLKISLEWGK
jgi:Trypsin-co-occurring domain 1